ncbi:DUF6059 family protein [Streptomyces sp. NPDC006458]|uniref:DUF6059 family protein n=1 Tax=Streptomyces sp. NPDC006458 TaxID=3154302 RepID=UPI0033B7D4BE
MRWWLRVCRRALTHYVLRPLWRSLVLFGSTQCGPHVYHEVATSLSASHLDGLFDRYARGGPPAAHPERVCEDVPLSEAERLLARELWLSYDATAMGRIRQK